MAHPITLYTVGTPNGWKASIALEELGLKYNVHHIQFSKMEQKEEWFLKLNPNGRIPTIVDHSRNDFAVFESGAILLYLAEHYDPEHKLLSANPDIRSQTIQWIMWQMGGLGPMMGQANHFVRYAPEKIPYGMKRYTDESLRLLQVLERQLSDGREYIVGEYSMADIACFGWVACYSYPGLSLETCPHVEKWLFRVGSRDAVRRGTNVPTPSTLIDDGFKMREKVAEDTAKKGKELLEQSAK
ncbi:Glutathione S-transferase 2 [Polyrhizophydium stewartii]|uniref:Glutathione S-transferase 2 n=1 Tax=Polyrhizophydium stewartii TaxID=2732419 RepID=A0ABR4N066_9FUNG